MFFKNDIFPNGNIINYLMELDENIKTIIYDFDIIEFSIATIFISIKKSR